MVFSVVKPFCHFRLRVAFKFLTVKVSDEVFSSTTSKHTSRVDVDNHHPLHLVFVTIHRQLDKVRTFELVRLYAIAFSKTTLILPVFQIRRRIETHLLVGRNNHIPLLRRFIPEHFRIAEVFQSVKRSQNRVLLVFCISTSIVIAVSHTLNLSVFVAGRGIESNDGILSVACAIILVNHCTS